MRRFVKYRRLRMKQGTIERKENEAQMEKKAKEEDWKQWRSKVINHIDKHRKTGMIWKLLNVEASGPEAISPFQLQNVDKKALAVLSLAL